MCLAVPVKIIKLDGNEAVIESQGVRRKADVSIINDVNVGDYVLLHAGFAISKWTQEDVDEYNKIINEMNDLM